MHSVDLGSYDYSMMTDEALLEEYDRLFRAYMYYQAAEGNWSAETKDRMACESQYYGVQREIRRRDIKTEW